VMQGDAEPVRVKELQPGECLAHGCSSLTFVNPQPAAQLTRGFQSLNIPLGLCFQIHACSS